VMQWLVPEKGYRTPGRAQLSLLRYCHRLSRDGRIRTIGLSILVSQLGLPLQRSTSLFHFKVARVRAMGLLARSPRRPITRLELDAHT